MRHGRIYADEPSYIEDNIRILRTDVAFQFSDTEYIEIYAGFEWDEASVPYLLQWAYPKSGKYAPSALIHDALYYLRYKSRAYADRVFYEWMKATINRDQAIIRYLFVRAFGWIYWNKKPSQRALKNRTLIKIMYK